MNAWLEQTEPLRQLAGWTMIHFLWIGAVVALLGAGVRFAARRSAPVIRYTISLITLATLALSPIAIAVWVHVYSPAILAGSESNSTPVATSTPVTPAQDEPAIYAPSQRVVVDLAYADPRPRSDRAVLGDGPPNASLPTPLPSAANPSPSPSLRGRGMLEALAPHLPWLWLAGAPLTFVLLAAGLIGSERLRRASTPLSDGAAVELCEQLRRALRITRRVSLAVCDNLAQPILVGIVRPLILLPGAALSGWTPEELEMVLLHELAHVRRWDNLVNLLQRIVESLLFFHPAVWLVSGTLRRDREECCDAVVVARSARPQAYATLLVSIAAKMQARRPALFVAASAMGAHPLAGRLRRILNLEDDPMWITRRTLALAFAVPLLLVAATVYTVSADEEHYPPPLKGGARGGTATPDIVEHKSDAEPPSADAADKRIAKNYPIADRDQVSVQKWVQILGRKDVEIQWFDNNNSMVLSAPQSVHKQIAELLEQARRKTDPLNQPEPPRREFQVFKLRYGRASLVAINLEDYFAGELTKGELRFVWDAETNTIIAQHATDAQLETIAKLLEIYDQPKSETPRRTNGQPEAASPPSSTQPIAPTAPALTPAEALKHHLTGQAPPPKPVYLYDGKTFDQWRDLWKHELKTERRAEAINALAAFARASYGQEAAEAIFDVAGEYDFSFMDQTSEGQLKQGLIDLLTLPGSSRVPESLWLQEVHKRLSADPKKWKWLSWHLLSRLQTADESTKRLLRDFEKFDDPAVRDAAKRAQEWVPDFVRNFMQRDQNGDGKLRADEFPPADWPMIQPADEDKDEALTEAELIKAAPEIQIRLDERRHRAGEGFF